MKKLFVAITVALVALSSCRSLKEEFDPVFTFGANEPGEQKLYSESELSQFGFTGTWTTIKELKSLYKGSTYEITSNIWIKGQIISSDVTGNIYREMYIQDETGGIDLKMGKTSLYSEYKLGQWIYVNCSSLSLGAYNGMPQLGMEPDSTPTNEYDTSYIDLQAIIDLHVFKGPYADPIKPLVISENDLKTALSNGYVGELWGKLVTIPGMKYGNEIFALVYPNPNMSHKSSNPENRVFLSGSGTWGITTWGLTRQAYIDLIESGSLDEAQVGSGNTRYGPITGRPIDYPVGEMVLNRFGTDAMLTYKQIMVKYATANYVSHYFTIGKTTVQVRTSGQARFSNEQLPSEIINDGKTCDITGILSIYSGSAQLSLVDEPGVSVKIN